MRSLREVHQPQKQGQNKRVQELNKEKCLRKDNTNKETISSKFEEI